MRFIRQTIVSCLLFFLIPLVVSASDTPLEVTVSIVPQVYFVKKIAGNLAHVSVMVLPGASPATYEPTPNQMKALATSSLYFAIGVPFETAWLDKMRAANPHMKVVATQEGITKMPMARHTHQHKHQHKHHGKHQYKHQDKHQDKHQHGDIEGHGRMHHHHEEKHHHKRHGHEHQHHAEAHGHGILDPHIWLAPELVRVQAQNICKALVAADPSHTEVYTRNLAAFDKELTSLDASIRETLGNVSTNNHFLVFHPAWGYFAKAYGLCQVPVEIEGKSPSPKDLAKLITKARCLKIDTVFVQPQFSQKSASVIARAMNGKVVRLDPLAADWAANLKTVALSLHEALR